MSVVIYIVSWCYFRKILPLLGSASHRCTLQGFVEEGRKIDDPNKGSKVKGKKVMSPIKQWAEKAENGCRKTLVIGYRGKDHKVWHWT